MPKRKIVPPREAYIIEECNKDCPNFTYDTQWGANCKAADDRMLEYPFKETIPSWCPLDDAPEEKDAPK